MAVACSYVADAPPRIFSVVPNHGSDDGGYSVTIHGRNLMFIDDENDSRVYFGAQKVKITAIHPHGNKKKFSYYCTDS